MERENQFPKENTRNTKPKYNRKEIEKNRALVCELTKLLVPVDEKVKICITLEFSLVVVIAAMTTHFCEIRTFTHDSSQH